MIRLKIADKIPVAFRNKYFLTIVIFVIWILLLDSNNLIARYRQIRELHKLKADKEYYSKRIETDKQKLHELKTDDNNLEKFAREQYHMKKPDEDLYIILTPREDRQITRRNN
ncbi:MAG: septum formation initiator family protein [Bacteroidales bacterium]|nr:septum formation initiator family protein [Bacteroidales bacterium]